MTNRDPTIDNIQSVAYTFPYHYLPSRSRFPRFARTWGFSASYLAAIGLFNKWLAGQTKGGGAHHRHLDIGCGDGGFLNSVAGSGKFPNVSFAGVDYDSQAILWANAFARQGCRFECKPISKLAGQEFDSASLIEVVEHIPPSELPKFVAEVAALLTENAGLFVTVPSVEKRVEAKHYRHFDFRSIAAVFDNDFDIIETKGFERIGLLAKCIRKLTQGSWHYVEVAAISDYLIASCEKVHDGLDGCGRIYLTLRKKRGGRGTE